MIVLVGPSASGKTELGKVLQKSGIEKLVTYTTREMRVGEINGIDYHFLNVDKFLELKENNFFFETVCYHNNYYGTSKSDLNRNVYLIVEPSGLDCYMKLNNVISFYMDVDYETRKQRMINRGDKPENIQVRLNGDDNIFTEEVKNKCSYVLDGTKSLEALAKEIREKL